MTYDYQYEIAYNIIILHTIARENKQNHKKKTHNLVRKPIFHIPFCIQIHIIATDKIKKACNKNTKEYK